MPEERIVTALFTHLYVLVVKTLSIIQQFGSKEAEDEIFQERHELYTFGLRHKERRSLCQTTIHAKKRLPGVIAAILIVVDLMVPAIVLFQIGIRIGRVHLNHIFQDREILILLGVYLLPDFVIIR